MTNTPILGLTMMSASQAQKEVVFNNFLIAMDALFKGSVLDVTLTAPPGSPAAGDAYIVAASPTCAWSGKAGKVTFYYNGWQFVSPSLKMRLYSAAQDAFYVYQSDSTWHAEPASTVSVLGDLTDVSGTATDGYVLTYVAADSKWEPKAAVYTASLHSLTDVNVTEGSGIDGKALVWNNTAGKWAAATVLTSIPGLLGLSDVVTTGVSGGFVPVYGATVGPGGTPGVHFIDPSSLITVSTLASVGDVSYPTDGAGAIPTGAYLQWNGSSWVPSTSAVVYSWEGMADGPGAFSGNAHKIARVNSVENAMEYVTNTLSNLADVSVTESTDIDGYVLAWNYGEQRWVAVAHGTNSLVALTDVTVVENSGYDGTFLYWNNGTSKWAQKLISWSDIQSKPTLFSGAYADLTGKPSLATVATSGAYSDLTGKPTLFSGAYADLTGAPSIPTNGSFNFASLGDVTITTGSGVDGYVVYWNNGASKFELKAAGGGTLATLTDVNVTEGSGIDGYYLKWDNGTSRWIAAAVSGGGGGSGSLSGDSDVTLTSPSDGQVLTYDAGSSKWINANATVGGGGGGGGGGSLPVNHPPIATALTAYTNLGGATLTQRTSGGIPSLSVASAGSDGNIYAAMELAPGGTFSVVVKVKVAGTTSANNWHGAGLAVYNSANTHFGSTMFNGANTLYPLGWTSTSGFTIHSTLNMPDPDFYQHIDYDGTLLKYGVSRNGIDVYWFYTETMSSTIGAITHVGIAWYGNGDYPYEFEHYHSGALGTSGITLGGGGGGGGAIESYSASSTSPVTYATAPTAVEAVPNTTVTVAASASSRTLMVSGNITWHGGGTAHPMRVTLYLDGAAVWPSPGVSDADGVTTYVGGDGSWNCNFSDVPIVIPGDNATHTLAIYWAASGATDGFTLKARNLFALNAGTSSFSVNANPPYDVGAFVGGVMNNGETLVGHAPSVNISIDSSRCYAEAVTAATGTTVVNINVGGTTIGTITWAASGTTGTFVFTGATTVSAGQLITLVAPGTADATLADVAITLGGSRT